jgi:hypothetical protein
MRKTIPGIIISISAIAIAATHIFDREDKYKIDSTTLLLLLIAAVPWLSAFLKSVTLPGGAVVEFREQIKELEKKVGVIEQHGLLPGRAEPIQESARKSIAHTAAGEDTGNTDPNKGQFGGKPEANGRVLEAKIEPAAGRDSAACNIFLTVRSTNKERPLTGTVTFHLHPTFGARRKYQVHVVDGVARDKITSWGVFTVGADADDGKTRLELDLSDVQGGTKKFYGQ